MQELKNMFLNEVEEMITSRQYNEEAMDKLITFSEIAQLIAERKKNQEEVQKFLYISMVSENLAERLYKLKKK